MYEFGDIVLIVFPFTNNLGVKKRPALVLLDADDNDILVARITSKIVDSRYDFQIRDWKNAGLLVPSFVRLHKIATLEIKLIDKKLGSLSALEAQKVSALLKQMF
jgi:mRNA interferase MazF